MKNIGKFLAAATLTVFAASGCKSVLHKETSTPQGLCAIKENPHPPATIYYAKRSSLNPKMLMFIGEENDLAFLCGFGPQEKEWWHVLYDQTGVLQSAWLYDEHAGHVAIYERRKNGFNGGRLDDVSKNISEAEMLEILGMKSPYLSEEVKLLKKIR